MLKKLGIAFVVVVVLLLGAIIILPFIIKVDDYRPRLVAMAGDYIDGKLEMGKLTLSLWGEVKVKVDGFSLTDPDGRKVIAAQDVDFHVPFGSILGGEPELTFRMERPEVLVVKDKTGKMNVLKLMKKKAPGTVAATPPPATAATTPAGPGKSLPSLVVKARLGVAMNHAHLSYKDELTALSSDVKDLNVTLKDISLSRATEFHLGAIIDTRMGKSLTIAGPLSIDGKAQPHFQGSDFKDSSLDVKANMDAVAISMPGVFEKKPGVIANADAVILASPTDIKIDRVTARFHNAVLTVGGTVTGLKATEGPTIAMTFKSNEIPLKPWSQLLPMLVAYDLNGSASVDGEVSGMTGALKYRADLALKNATAKAPNLKVEPKFDAEIKVVTDQVQSMDFSMKAPGCDLRATGKVVSFTAPKVDLAINSTGLDLDQLMDFGPPKPPPPAPGKDAKTAAAPPAPAKAADYDALVAPLRENKIAAQTVAQVHYRLASLKVKGAKMTDINGNASFKGLAFAIDGFRMGLFGGTIGLNGRVALAPKVPTYSFHADVAGLQLGQAVQSQMTMFQNTLLGDASFKIDGSGASFNPEPAKANMNAKGNFAVKKGQFATLDLGKVAVDAINKALGDAAAKVPQLQGKKLATPNNQESKYEVISSSFAILAGKFSAPDFLAKAEPQKGIDAKGDTALALKDFGLKAGWELIDTNNWTKARDLSVDINGVKIEHVLAEGNNPVKFPIKIGGTAMAPEIDYQAVPAALVAVALNNISKAAEGKAKAELKKQAEEQIKKVQAPPEVKKALQGLGDKLFGH